MTAWCTCNLITVVIVSLACCKANTSWAGFVASSCAQLDNESVSVFRLARSDKERVFGGGLFGLGLLVVAAIMSHGHACGCTKAEMLAINDNGKQ